MTDTANLGLPCIEGSQAQKHITHNDALRILDTLVQLAVLDRDLTAPPSSPAEGQRWIVKATGTGAWSGHDNAVAAWQDGGWQFSVPQTGWVAFVEDEGTLLVWNGTAWGEFFSTVTSIQNLVHLGIGTTADDTNPLSARLNNVLLAAKTVAEGGSGDVRTKLSKEASSNTASFLFQDNYSGRAEIGLAGDDDFHFKVSPDGSTWVEAFRIAAATGKVTFPISGGPREILAAARTYYVRTDGSDSNNGLSNSAGGAFLTLQKAYNALQALDTNGYAVTVQIADGTYVAGVTLSTSWLGGGLVTFQGNSGTPGNVIVQNAFAVSCVLPSALTVKDMKLSGSTGLKHAGMGVLQFGNVEFSGTPGLGHIWLANPGAIVRPTGGYMISGGGLSHIFNGGGFFDSEASATVTVSGTPAFSSAFLISSNNGTAVYRSTTFSGSATGKRYVITNGGVIDTGGAGASYFPGNAAGTNDGSGAYA